MWEIASVAIVFVVGAICFQAGRDYQRKIDAGSR